MKIPPRPVIGVVVLLCYLAVFYGVWVATGIEYDDIGDSASTLLRWYVAPLAAGALVLVVAASVLGWWRASLFEEHRAPGWTLITPALMLTIALVALTQKDFSETTDRMLLYLVLGSIGVGFCEELSTRGILLTGLRGSWSEGQVWFGTSLLFGLLHLPNWLFGSGPTALGQVVLAFMSGSTFYLLRRGSGTLLTAMVLHGVWDFTAFAGDGGEGVMFLNLPVAAGSVVVAIVLVRRERSTGAPAAASADPAPV